MIPVLSTSEIRAMAQQCGVAASQLMRKQHDERRAREREAVMNRHDARLAKRARFVQDWIDMVFMAAREQDAKRREEQMILAAMADADAIEIGRPTMRRLLERTGEKYGVSRSEFRSDNRTRHVSIARMEFCFLAHNLTNASLPMIGQFINKDHTSVLHAVRRYRQFQEMKAGIRTPTGNDVTLDLTNIIPIDEVLA